MKKSRSFPTLVWYTDYTDCTIRQALLAELRDGPLPLDKLGNIRVNGYRLIGSYGKAIQNLRRAGYDITTIIEHKGGHTLSSYILNNPLHNGTIYD